MVGRPGTGKSMLANMFKEVLEKSLGDYLRPKHAIVGYPGKDRNHIRFAYENPAKMDKGTGGYRIGHRSCPQPVWMNSAWPIRFNRPEKLKSR